MDRPGISIVCMKWGNAYQPKHVNNLLRDTQKHLSMPFEFVLIGDNNDGINPTARFVDIETLGILPSRYQAGLFPKLVLYRRDLFPDRNVVLFMDLDILICGDLDRFIHRIVKHRGVHIQARRVSGLWPYVPRKWRRDRGGNTTVIGFIANENCNLFERFVEDPDLYLRTYKNDQDYVTGMAETLHYWPKRWLVLLKRKLLWPHPVNLLLRSARVPRNCLVSFGGYPKLEEFLGEGELRFGSGRKRKIVKLPVKWIAEQWRN